MSEHRRILEAGSDAAPLVRDLVSSARSDAAPAGARQRARARMEAALGSEGMTTGIGALSEGAAGRLILPNLSPVAVPKAMLAPPADGSMQDTGTATAPSARRARGGRTVVYASASGAMALVIALIGVSVVLRKGAMSPAPVAAPVAPVVAPVAAPVAPSAPVALAPIAAPAAGGTSVAMNGAGGSVAESGGGGGGGGGRGGARASRNGGGASGSGGGGGVASTGGGPCSARCHGNIDCLLRCSTQGPAASSASAAGGGGGGGAASGNAPEMPSRTAVIAALRGAAARVSACGQGRSGIAQISITFGSAGHVTTANVAPPYAGTPAGACMARAVRTATLPRFSRPTFTVNYPFSIR